MFVIILLLIYSPRFRFVRRSSFRTHQPQKFTTLATDEKEINLMFMD